VTPWVLRLLAANVLMFLLQLGNPHLTAQLELYPPLLLLHPWTLVTYMFLHAGWGHLIFNMMGLYILGPRVEMVLGGSRFLVLYFLSGIAGALFFFLTPGDAAIIGASGAIFGVYYGYAHYWPRDRLYIWGVVPVEARVLVVIMAALSLGLGATGSGLMGNVAHFGHLGGFAGAFLFFKWLERASGAARFRARAAPVASKGSSEDVERWSKIARENLHPVNREELDRVLAKLAASGADALTRDERAFLDRVSPPPMA
jgi:rhomboid family protein